ncbi:MAG: RNA-binding S4 domain-containing protein, partial [Kiritimatiellaceae bacterium]|nr:RNA-binding S4 domain-containing protein [Kiritimatiellaceae bacterium]
MIEFTLTGETIDLFQLLKATSLCGTGGEAKIMIDEGRVYVDGEVETRKRCKIRSGQTISYN